MDQEMDVGLSRRRLGLHADEFPMEVRRMNTQENRLGLKIQV